MKTRIITNGRTWKVQFWREPWKILGFTIKPGWWASDTPWGYNDDYYSLESAQKAEAYLHDAWKDIPWTEVPK